MQVLAPAVSFDLPQYIETIALIGFGFQFRECCFGYLWLILTKLARVNQFGVRIRYVTISHNLSGTHHQWEVLEKDPPIHSLHRITIYSSRVQIPPGRPHLHVFPIIGIPRLQWDGHGHQPEEHVEEVVQRKRGEGHSKRTWYWFIWCGSPHLPVTILSDFRACALVHRIVEWNVS